MARNWVQMDIDTRKADKKLNRLHKKLKKQGELTVHELGEMGKQYARSKAPYFSGQTFQNIYNMTGENSSEATIMARNPTASDGHARGPASAKYNVNGRFHLVKWMHESPHARAHIHSGQPQFMYLTRDWLQKTAPGKASGDFRKIVFKVNNS